MSINFNESEAFLAIVSVSAFACVLIDQIAGRLAHDEAATEVEEKHAELTQEFDVASTPLTDLATKIFREFSRQHNSDSSIQTEIQLMGALSGFFSAIVPELEVILDYKLSSDSHERCDLFLRYNDNRVLVELKRTNSPRQLKDGIAQLHSYMSLTGIMDAILFMYPPSGGELAIEELPSHNGGKIIVLRST